MKNWFPKLSALLLMSSILFVAACNAPSGEGIDLKLKFNVGDQYLYTSHVEQEIDYTEAKVQQEVTMEMIYEMKAEEGQNNKLNITYKRMDMNTTTPLGSVSYNSDTDSTAEQSDLAALGAIINQSFDIIIAADGSIVRVEGLDSMMAAMSSVEGAQQAALSQQFSDSSIRNMMQSSFDMYPGHPVKPGDTWTKNTTLNMSGMSISNESKYTLESVVDDVATIHVASTMSLPKNQMSGQGVAIEMEMDGTQNGMMTVSISTGQVLTAETIQEISGKMKAAGQEMPMKIKGKVSVKSEKL